jgi:predicted GNAT superfamily acetyltransferase
MIKELVKIEIPESSSFGERERQINVQTQKLIDSFVSRGYLVIDHKIINKASAYATIGFTLRKI